MAPGEPFADLPLRLLPHYRSVLVPSGLADLEYRNIGPVGRRHPDIVEGHLQIQRPPGLQPFFVAEGAHDQPVAHPLEEALGRRPPFRRDGAGLVVIDGGVQFEAGAVDELDVAPGGEPALHRAARLKGDRALFPRLADRGIDARQLEIAGHQVPVVRRAIVAHAVGAPADAMLGCVDQPLFRILRNDHRRLFEPLEVPVDDHLLQVKAVGLLFPHKAEMPFAPVAVGADVDVVDIGVAVIAFGELPHQPAHIFGEEGVLVVRHPAGIGFAGVLGALGDKVPAARAGFAVPVGHPGLAVGGHDPGREALSARPGRRQHRVDHGPVELAFLRLEFIPIPAIVGDRAFGIPRHLPVERGLGRESHARIGQHRIRLDRRDHGQVGHSIGGDDLDERLHLGKPGPGCEGKHDRNQ